MRRLVKHYFYVTVDALLLVEVVVALDREFRIKTQGTSDHHLYYAIVDNIPLLLSLQLHLVYTVSEIKQFCLYKFTVKQEKSKN